MRKEYYQQTKSRIFMQIHILLNLIKQMQFK